MIDQYARRESKRRARAARHRTVMANVRRHIEPKTIEAMRPKPRQPHRTLAGGLVVMSAALHAAPVLAFHGRQERVPQAKRVAIVIQPVPPAPQPPVPIEPAVAVEQPAPTTVAKRKTAPKQVTEAPAPPAQAAPSEPPPVVAGVDLSSTVTGSGPAFAVGNHRMGQTETRARDARSIEPLSSPSLDGTSASSPNRAATRIPGATSSGLVKPKRKQRLQPDYPSELKAQGIEANVTVQVRLDKHGAITDVDIVSPAAEAAFNTAAEQTARREQFFAATRDGKPIPYTLTFTYRFRLSDA